MKTYSNPSSDLTDTIDAMMDEYHLPLLENVRVGALLVYDDEAQGSVLHHHGYPAVAVIKITSLRERALGLDDAIIIVDRWAWQTLSAATKKAVIDHELEHLDRVVDVETGGPVYDSKDRPKLKMRAHDHQFGWFDSIVTRHGEASIEMRQARQLVESTKQLYFDFSQLTPQAA